MHLHRFSALCALSLLLAAGSAHAQVGTGAVAYNGGATQDFDTLASAGTTASNLPVGWYFVEAGTNANGTYGIDNGTAPSGNTFSYGSSGSTDRAFGALGSGSLSSTIGAQLQNTTGTTLTALDVSFVTEQWRLGDLNGADRLAFAYSTDATTLNNGTWIAFSALDAVSPVTAGTASSRLDGNAAANRATITATLTGLSVAPNGTLWVRWADVDDPGVDDALAIDDVVFGTPVDNPPAVVETAPINGATGVPVGALIEVAFNETITVANAAGITLDCGAGTPAIAATANGATLVITPASALPYGASCSVSIAADAVNDTDSTPDPMDAPYAFGFSTQVDNPPTLLPSTPADGSSDFPANANLQLTFSEAVTLGADWFDIACSTSGPRGPADVAVSGGPSAFSLNPSSDFVQGESCVLTLDAAAITDQDGVADTLAGPNTIAFVPAAPIANQPPMVLATTPMDGDSSFPSAGDLVVLFSEAVTVSPGAFTLSCTASTGIVLSHASSGTSFTIDTGTALVAEDTCTFTIHASLVQDSEGANPAANEVVNFTVFNSADTDAYYQNVNLSSPEQLRCSLYETIKGHTKLNYTYTVLNLADEDPVDSTKILDLYRNASYTSYTGGDATHNREHTWPRSLGLGSTGTPGPATDYHMLHLTDTGYNSSRGSKPYGNCGSDCIELPTVFNHNEGGNSSNWYSTSNSAASNPFPCSGAGENCKTFEVWDARKGDMARAVMYMAIRYKGENGEPDLELTDNRNWITSGGVGGKHYMGLLTHLLEWNASDAPTDREVDRNQIVQSFQNNRNPFTDHPEWATEALFTASRANPCVLNAQAPVAMDDAFATPVGTPITVSANAGVLANDSDAEGAPLTARLISSVGSGTLALSADGGFTFTPANGFCGSASFTYSASDGVRLSTPSTATIAVGSGCGLNTAPVAVADSYAATEDTTLTVTAPGVLANDTDADADPLTAVLVGNVQHGTLSLAANGGFTYTPAANYCGSDGFTYRANDGQDNSAVASVALTVACVNDAPVAVADSYAATEDTTLTVTAPGVLANDSDVDGNPLTAVLVGNVQHGTLSLGANGGFIYIPAANYCGSDGFTYRANDGQANSTEVAVALTVACVNDAPVAVADSYAIDQDLVLTVPTASGVLANDSDVDGDSLSADLVADVLHGTLALAADGGFTYTPDAGFCGDDSFVYRSLDGAAASADQTVAIRVNCTGDAIFSDGFESDALPVSH